MGLTLGKESILIRDDSFCRLPDIRSPCLGQDFGDIAEFVWMGCAALNLRERAVCLQKDTFARDCPDQGSEFSRAGHCDVQ